MMTTTMTTTTTNRQRRKKKRNMVVSNSTPINNGQKHGEFKVNTSAINSADFSQLLQLNEEIEQCRAQRHSMSGDGSGLLKATMTREELFEVSSMDDDRFLTALEHQNSYTTPSRVQVTDLDLSSIENLMKYFDEDVPVTPIKSPAAADAYACQGKVAHALATLRSKVAPQEVPADSPSKRLGGKVKINELKQKYEDASKNQPPKVNKPANLPMKVKEMAQLFNTKINQVMRRSSDGQRYKELQNEYSPEMKPKPMSLTKRASFKQVTYKLPGLPSPVPSPRLRRRALQKPAHSPCLVAEEVFRELSVKDKVLLFNKFVGDMAAKHPKFNDHAEVIKAQVTKQMARGEVVAEQQASVKDLAKELEAKCALSSSNNSFSPGRSCFSPTRIGVAENNGSTLHVSTLTVVLKPSPSPKRHTLSLGRTPKLVSPSNKRNLAAIRSILPTEAYAPPKKIRRTRTERSNGEFFQNTQMENLFYTWLREENGVLFDITSATNEDQTIEIAIDEELEDGAANNISSNISADVTQKSAVERLLEEAIAKLEESKADKELSIVEEKEIDTAGEVAIESPQVARTTKEVQEEVADGRDTSSTATPIHNTPMITPRKKRNAPAPPKPIPAPRLSLQSQSSSLSSSSATSSCKQSGAEESESGLSTLPKITSDESQPETKQTHDAQTAEFEFAKPLRPPRKKKMRRTLTWKKENCIVEAKILTSTDSDSEGKKLPPPVHHHHGKKKAPQTSQFVNSSEQSFIELDKSLMRQVNSPRKIKSAYTLTVMSSPSVDYLSETPRPSVDPSVKSSKSSPVQPRSLADSFVDQGFETGSNEHSPMRPSLREMQSLSSLPSPRPTMDGTKPTGFSTPVKGQGPRNSVHSGSVAQQQLFSPINQGNLIKQQRDPRRSSLAMQVIKEDHPLDLEGSSGCSMPPTPCSFNGNESTFFVNASSADMDPTMSKQVSKFWLSIGDLTISLDVFYNTPDRLRVLYEIFTQKITQPRILVFGIDGQKFALNENQNTMIGSTPVKYGIPKAKGCSHYWFATGDLTVPFSGKYMSAEKVQRLFKFIAEERASASGEEFRFGVDHIEFSSTPEFWLNTPKFSMESSYSMLVGLQTGNSNGLEGRSKYSWPNNSAAIKTSDLDPSEFESDTFSNSGSGRLSFSPDLFSLDYENVPLDELFDHNTEKPERISIAPSKLSKSKAQMLKTIQQQQITLKEVEERLLSYSEPDNLSDDSLDQFRNTSEYVPKLRRTVRAIERIGRDTGFEACSMEQLESFMYFLSEYTDVCLANCSKNMNKILDTLLDRRSVVN